MRVRYSFRTEKGRLPDALTLMETTRAMHDEITRNPREFWKSYEEWIQPMNQLQNGVFVSINYDSKDFSFTEYFNGKSELKLEYTQLGRNYAKIMFNYEGDLPYRIPSGKISRKPTQMHSIIITSDRKISE